MRKMVNNYKTNISERLRNEKYEHRTTNNEYEKSDSKIEFYGTIEDLTRCCCYSVEDVYREMWED